MGNEAEHPPLPLAPGDVVAGKYVVVRVIGRGGMGSVFEAKHRALGQRVAIKILHAQEAGHEEAVERFLREARAAASLGSDHVVRVFDVGMHDTGLPFMVMELLEGVDLGDLIERGGAVAVGDAVRWVLQAAEAVAEAHEAGIVHRDLKPSNLFLVRPSTAVRTGRVKVVDFGISKQGNMPAGSMLTLTGPRSVMGSPSYMSPEQVRSTKSVDARTDVWSLGVILYELLTGRTAFDGETLGDVFAKIREESLPPIREIRPSVPASLEAIIDRCLRRDREHRFADAAALAEALRAVELEGRGDKGWTDEARSSLPEARLPRPSQATTAFDLLGAPPSRPSSSTHAPWIGARRTTPRRRLTLGITIGAASVALAFVVVAVASLTGGDATGPDAAVPAADGLRPTADVRIPVVSGDEVVPATSAGGPLEAREPVVTPRPDPPATAPSSSAAAKPPPVASSSSRRGQPSTGVPKPGVTPRHPATPAGNTAAPPGTRVAPPHTAPRGGDPDDLGI